MNSPKTPLRIGDVVLVDLGYLGKVRPCLILAPYPDSQHSQTIVAPLTTESRGGEAEIGFPKPRWLDEPCVVNLAGLAGVERAKIKRQLGVFPAEKLKEAKAILAMILGLEQPPVQPGT